MSTIITMGTIIAMDTIITMSTIITINFRYYDGMKKHWAAPSVFSCHHNNPRFPSGNEYR
ncbi:hypothetical protein KDA_17890 [Dictyobacter alpinus]|uniref:Uncharacterized protein n=1 Tax=Dictyobacter alpinus TaxID=2014873 RepID=A0A402B4L7_9CHLR|nr:hypothetical protein KDA_17890 [Dictyobacter alpinus]